MTVAFIFSMSSTCLDNEDAINSTFCTAFSQNLSSAQKINGWLFPRGFHIAPGVFSMIYVDQSKKTFSAVAL